MDCIYYILAAKLKKIEGDKVYDEVKDNVFKYHDKILYANKNISIKILFPE